MTDPSDHQPRKLHRQRVLKRATILGTVTQSEVGCSIRNMHKDGAELRVAPEAMIPTTFLLYVPVDGTAYQAEIRWRSGDRVGVQFSGTAPKPHWHYG